MAIHPEISRELNEIRAIVIFRILYDQLVSTSGQAGKYGSTLEGNPTVDAVIKIRYAIIYTENDAAIIGTGSRLGLRLS